MPREYQLKTTGNAVPHNVYKQVIYIIKDYPRRVRERESVLYSTPYNDGQPRGSGTGRPAEAKALRLAVISGQMEAVDAAVHDLNSHYNAKIKRDDVDYFDSLDAFDDYGYFCYVLYDPGAGKEPSVRTWKYFRQTFVHKVAQKLNLI